MSRYLPSACGLALRCALRRTVVRISALVLASTLLVDAAIVVSLGFSRTAIAEPAATFLNGSTVPLSNPHDLKLSPDGKYLFVSDVGNDRIAILDPDTLKFQGSFGSDHQSGTHDIDFDSLGRAYVADTHNNRVTIYKIDDLTADLVGELSAGVRGPEGVLLHPNGRIYVAGAWSGNLVAYEGSNVVKELDGLSSPHDVELAPGGDLWLSDAGNDRMLLLSPDLKIKRELKGPPYNFKGVRYQDVLADGTVIAADKNNHQVKFIAADGKLVLVLGDGQSGMGANRFRTPEGIEVRGNILWISDSGNNRIVRYRINLQRP
ncbi:MAG: NHL repeat-containing protein [Hyphomicrobiaceae bacterium]